MQTKRKSLAEIQGKLSRSEMKNIIAGNKEIDEPARCTHFCDVNTDCTDPDCPTCKAISQIGQKYCLA